MWNPTDAAKHGASYFNKLDPEWFMSIDAARLDVGSHCDCIVGQRYGDFWHGLDMLPLRFRDAATLGFHVPEDMYTNDSLRDAAFRDLTAAWRDEIAARRFQRITSERGFLTIEPKGAA